MPRPDLSLVIPIYNEEEVLPALDERLRHLMSVLDLEAEVVFVDDGSRDRSMEMLRHYAGQEPRYKVLSFARNFGHQRAVTCGMRAARGRAVVIMDADLQDPPEVVLELVNKWREGYDVVHARRRSRAGETAFKLFTAKIFYRLFAAMIPIKVPLDTGDFRLMSRRVILKMRKLGETNPFVRGLVAWVGFRQTEVEYDRAARFAGETKYPLRKMLAFAMDGIASFSILPLRFATYAGVLVGLASVLYAFAAVITYIVGVTVPGWTTTVVLTSFLFSVQLLVTGVLGEYVGRIYEQVKARPLYLVAEKINIGKHKNRPRAVPEMRERLESVDISPAGEHTTRAILEPRPMMPSRPPPLPAPAPAPMGHQPVAVPAPPPFVMAAAVDIPGTAPIAGRPQPPQPTRTPSVSPMPAAMPVSMPPLPKSASVPAPAEVVAPPPASMNVPPPPRMPSIPPPVPAAPMAPAPMTPAAMTPAATPPKIPSKPAMTAVAAPPPASGQSGQPSSKTPSLPPPSAKPASSGPLSRPTPIGGIGKPAAAKVPAKPVAPAAPAPVVADTPPEDATTQQRFDLPPELGVKKST